MHSIFLELTLVLILAGSLAYLMNFLKQPSIVAYIAAGLIIGPIGAVQINQAAVFHDLSQIGITLLLFMVGLEMDFGQVKKLGKTILIAGISQMALTFGFFYAVLTLFGYPANSSLFIAIALTFSSTIIVVKLLSEKRDLESLYGKIAVGILLLQDVAAIALLIILGSMSPNGDTNSIIALYGWQKIIFTLAKALSIGLLVAFVSKYIWPKILKFIGKSDEYLLVSSLAWALGLAAFLSLPIIGFGVEIGGFIAGLALANSAVHYQIGNRIKSIRDFFLIIFFITLGIQFGFDGGVKIILPALLLSAIVLVSKPFITMIILGALGYKPKTGYGTGISLSQVSEFSLILLPIGLKLNLVSSTEASTLTLVAIISIVISSYAIEYANKFYLWFHHPLSIFDFKNGEAEKNLRDLNLKNHIVLLGGHRLGHHVIECLLDMKKEFIFIDFNPDIVDKFKKRGVLAICGDITDPHIQHLSYLEKAKVVISTISDLDDNMQILENVRKTNSKAKIILTAKDENDALKLYKEKANYVILPHFIGGLHIADLIGEDLTLSDLPKLKKEHLRIIKSEKF